MSTTKGPRAARARKLIDGRAWNGHKQKRTTIILLPGVLEIAEQYNICSPQGRGGMQTIGEYVQDKLIADIRAKEKERSEK